MSLVYSAKLPFSAEITLHVNLKTVIRNLENVVVLMSIYGDTYTIANFLSNRIYIMSQNKESLCDTVQYNFAGCHGAALGSTGENVRGM